MDQRSIWVESAAHRDSQDCYGCLDEQEASDAGLWYRDEDGDGFGQDEAPIRSCEALPSTVAQAGDCDDGDAAVSPGATEICDDGLDNNCDESASPCAFSGDYDLNDADVIFTGASGDEAGWAMCGGDLNHDGADDLAIGAPGAAMVYVVYGPLPPGEHKLSDADLRISGASGSELGYALLCTDLNDDGEADLAVGAPGDSEVTQAGPSAVGQAPRGDPFKDHVERLLVIDLPTPCRHVLRSAALDEEATLAVVQSDCSHW